MLGRGRATIYPRLAELESARRIFSPAKGLYVVVPPEYRSWGVVPADWFIDPMMRHLGRSYYVSFLAAAARHGVAHQSPQAFQTVVDSTVRDRDLGRVRLRFVKTAKLEELPTERATSHTGEFTLATRETTAVDLAWRPRHGGGISNVAGILRGLEEIDPQLLARGAAVRGRATARRLGWLLQQLRPELDLYWLGVAARADEGSPAALVPGNPVRGPVDPRWGLRINGELELD